MNLAAFAPSHTVPDGGLDAWDTPDPTLAPSARLDPWLPLQAVASNGGWTRVLCANGWSAWVDGAALVPARRPAGPAPQPAASTGEPVPTVPALGVTTWMAIAGGVAVAVSAFLPWVSLKGVLGAISASAFQAPLELLWNVQASPVGLGASTSPLTVGLAVVATGAAGVAAVFLPPRLDLVRRAAGGLAVFIASDFVRQLSSALTELNRASNSSTGVLSVLGVGVFVAIVGGGLMLIGTSRRPSGRPA